MLQDALVQQRVGDVFGDGERIEQAALLKQNADPCRAYRTGRCSLRRVISWPNRQTRPESGRTRPTATLSSMVFPLPAAPEDHAGLAGVHLERHVIERRGVVEMEADVFETQDGGIAWRHVYACH